MYKIINEMVLHPELSKFLSILNQTSVEKILWSNGPYTVFVPQNEAFSVYSENYLGELLEDKENLNNLISNHIIIGYLKIKDLYKMDEVTNLSNINLPLEWVGKKILIDGGMVVDGDIKCQNGLIHIIDTLMRGR